MGGTGGHFPPPFGQGGYNIFCPPQHFVMKSNVVGEISWLHCCKRFPSIKPLLQTFALLQTFPQHILLQTFPQHKTRE